VILRRPWKLFVINSENAELTTSAFFYIIDTITVTYLANFRRSLNTFYATILNRLDLDILDIQGLQSFLAK